MKDYGLDFKSSISIVKDLEKMLRGIIYHDLVGRIMMFEVLQFLNVIDSFYLYFYVYGGIKSHSNIVIYFAL